MIYEFKSRATGSVVMTRPVAEWILKIIGKDPGPTGIITVDQMPGAIAALRQAIDEEKRELRAAQGSNRSDTETDEKSDDYPVSLAQRAYPFIEMLEQAHRGGKDVTWGV
ncbi:MAG: DUF1840 domain-containing protein [Burkholderiaceae bacterium]